MTDEITTSDIDEFETTISRLGWKAMKPFAALAREALAGREKIAQLTRFQDGLVNAFDIARDEVVSVHERLRLTEAALAATTKMADLSDELSQRQDDYRTYGERSGSDTVAVREQWERAAEEHRDALAAYNASHATT